MLNEHYDVTTAAYAVGYESLSHFRREYLRIVVGLLLMLMASPLDSRWATQWFWLRLLALIMSK